MRLRILLPVFISIAAVLLAPGCGAIPQTTLTRDDVPASAGTTYSAYQNTADEGLAPIDLTEEGPWDFTEGPDTKVTKSVLVQVSQAAGRDKFEEAGYAEKVLPSDYTRGFTAYNFVKLTDDSLLSFGQSVTPGENGPTINAYDKPERLLKLPMKVGDKWSDTVVIEGASKATVELKREVIARGQVRVPAGSFFNCFMVRLIKTVKTSDEAKASRVIMYFWWAPDVGLVAAAGSEPDEKDLFFKNADYLFRLKSYTIK